MENGIQYINGKPYDLNGAALSLRGSTAYLGVVKCKETENGKPLYAAIWTHGKNYHWPLFGSTDLNRVAWVANYARKCKPTVDELNKSRCGHGAGYLSNKLWANVIGLEVPENFDYPALPDDYSAPIVRNKRNIKKVSPKETNITEEFVGKQVNTLLGNKVDVKTRIKIKDMVVANTAFYRTVEDVTAYVNDLVKYNIK